MRKPVYSRVYANAPEGESRAEAADREWASLCDDLKERGQMTDQRKRIIDRLVRERVEYEFLAPIVAAEGPVKEGPNGGDVFNFKWSALHKIKDQILKLEEALKLTVDKSEKPEGKAPPKTAADKYLAKIGPH